MNTYDKEHQNMYPNPNQVNTNQFVQSTQPSYIASK
jgi:hypothetical protein